jgi:hypothetical protein
MIHSFLLASTACAALMGLLVACAGDAEPSDGEPGPPPPDASGGDVRDAASADAEAGPCTDCEYFPTECRADILCSNGPYDTGPDSLDRRAQLNAIRGRSPSDVWVVGALGAAAHFDGTSWTRSDVGGGETLRTIWLRNSAEVAFGTFESIYTRGVDIQEGDAGVPSPGGWAARGSAQVPSWQIYDPTRIQLTSAWAAPEAQWLWCTTTTYHVSQNSGLWRMRMSPTGNPIVEIGIPAAICRDLPCSQMTSIHGRSKSDLWTVGYKGASLRILDADSDTPTLSVFNTQTYVALFGVWEAPDSEIWAVGANGTIRRHKGNSVRWDVIDDVPTMEHLRAVSGSSGSDIWAVGDRGVVLHYDGATWSRVEIAGLGLRRPDLTAVWVPEPGHVWIGGIGVILSLGGKP